MKCSKQRIQLQSQLRSQAIGNHQFFEPVSKLPSGDQTLPVHDQVGKHHGGVHLCKKMKAMVCSKAS